MPTSKNEKVRLKLFELYSKNWDRVKGHEQIQVEPDVNDSIICPLCLENFERKDLNQNLSNPLTLEDVPPKLLKTAYLLAISKLGYSYLLNPGVYKIREQIMNPDKNIISSPFWINFDFPNSTQGVNILSGNEDLQCFLIIIKLSTKSNDYFYNIALPGFTMPGFYVYENIERLLCSDTEGHVNIVLQHLSDVNVFENPNLTWYAHYMWQTYASETHQ